MISEIGKLRMRKKVPLHEPGSVFKEYNVYHAQTLQNVFKTWTASPLTSGLQSSSRKWLIRRVVTIRLVRCNENC